MRRFVLSIPVGLLLVGLFATLPAAGQTLVGVLGGTAVNADDPGAVVTIGPNGAATVLGTPIPGESLTGVAQLADGRVVASTATFLGPSRLIEINPATGALIANIGPFMSGQTEITIHDLTADKDNGILYGVAVGEADRGDGSGSSNGAGGSPTDVNAIFSIDPNTGACTYLGTPDLPDDDFLAIAYSSANVHLWGMPTNSPDLYQLDPATAQITQTILSLKEHTQGALGLGEVNTPMVFIAPGCCAENIGNDIYAVDALLVYGNLIGPAGGTRRVHDVSLVFGGPPGPGPGQAIVEVPTLGTKGVMAMALLLAVAGSALLFWRR